MAKRNLESFCFCLPVRHGLLVWGYAKLVISLVVVSTFTYLAVRMFSLVPESYEYAITFLECVTTTIPELLDLTFTLVLIIAAHKRNLKMLEVYYFYSITILAVYFLVILLNSCNKERFQMLHDMIFHHSWLVELDQMALLYFGLGNICFQAYLMMLVRSEVLKQRNLKKAKLARQKSSASFRGLKTGMVLANSPPISK